MKSKIRPVKNILYFMIALFTTSCIDGYKDDITFTVGVTNTQLVSPDADGIKVTTVSNDAGQEELNFEWPVVYGAGGYEFSLYIVDDPDNPILVGEENQFIDGCSVRRIKEEDTKYKAIIRALGNEKYNNATALTATEFLCSTLVPVYALIPDGSDISAYFEANPIQPFEEGVDEIAYELVAGGNYTLNKTVDFGLYKITLRTSDKLNRANITYGVNGRISTMGGLKLKFINFDCSTVTKDMSDASFLMLNKDPEESLSETHDGNTHYIVHDEIVIQSCNIKGVNRYLLYDNSIKYCLKKFRIQDCIISINSADRFINMNSGGGFINDLTLSQSTFYSLEDSSNPFIQYGSSGRPARGGFMEGAINLFNNTFYNIASKGQFGNYSGMNHASVNLRLTRNLFVNCGDKYVVRRISGGGTNMKRSFVYNCYWYDGGFADGEEMGHSQGDKSGTGFYEIPNFVGPVDNIDPVVVDFTPKGSEILKQNVGDPRWLTGQ